MEVPPRQPPTKRQPTIRLALPEGPDRERLTQALVTLTVIFAVDDSGSMYGQWADDAGVRYAAARSVVDLMVRGGGGRAGVIHWGGTAPPEMALAPVDVKRGRRRLDQALQIPPGLNWTDVVPALHLARELLTEAGGSRQAVLVLTDGLQEPTAAVAAAIQQLPKGSVHILLIDHWHECTEELEAAWRAQPLGSLTRLTLNDPAQLTWEVADVLVTSCGVSLRPLPAQKRRRFQP
jgi:hypothetical protein